ncbi:MAG: hypothetical protein OXU70_02125 [Gammaproteobacteria bacterium]|nr:hypothetical protein [Gammaproteobacteria bacterium]
MNIKQIVCLANSRKLSGRCIAGREWDSGSPAGDWIRPVSARDGREVSEYERQYEDGSDPVLLDIVAIPVLRRQPENYQTENWLLDEKYYWRKIGAYSRFELSNLVDVVDGLWINGHSTYSGINDKIPIEHAASLSGSLRLVQVEKLTLSVFAPGEAFGNSKRRVQGRFEYAGERYALWVTDPGYEREYLKKLNGTYALGPCHLTISLGEPYDGFCYKLIAAIIKGEPA